MLGTATSYPPSSAITDMPVKMEGQTNSYLGNQPSAVTSPYMQPPSTYTSLFRRSADTMPDSSSPTAVAASAYTPMFASSMFGAAAGAGMDPLYGLHDMSTSGNYAGYGTMAAYGYMSPYYR